VFEYKFDIFALFASEILILLPPALYGICSFLVFSLKTAPVEVL